MAAAPIIPMPLPAALPEHPVHRVVYRDSDHSYRLRNECQPCNGSGVVDGKRPGTTKKCPTCRGEGAKYQRVAAVSTVLAELNKPALVPWAARMGADALLLDLYERAHRVMEESPDAIVVPVADFGALHERVLNAHRDLKDEAAATGTDVHEWITEHGNDVLTAPLPDDPAIRPACEEYVRWWRTAGYTVVEAERIVVDPAARYAGRFDLLVRDRRGRLFVLDIKTSNSIYLEHVLQCSAYASALRQETGESVAGTVVVWCHKDGRPVRTVERTARQYRADFRIFAALLGVYEHRKALGSELRRIAKESEIDASFAFPF